MTLDELATLALEKYYAESYAGCDVVGTDSHSDMVVAVLAVLEEVRRAMPEELDLRGGVQAMGWNYCRNEMLRRLDEMSK